MITETLKPADILAELPKRTRRRPVRSVMQSTRAADAAIGDAIVELAQGDRLQWTHAEAVELVRDLERETMPLEAWAQIVQANQ